MRFGDLKNRVYDRLGEDSTSPDRFPEFLVYDLLREACEQWIVQFGGRVQTTGIALAVDIMDYALPKDCIQIIELLDATNSIPLTPVHWRDMYERMQLEGRSWRDVRDTRPWHYFLFGLDRVHIWPAQTSLSVPSVTLTYLSSDLEDLDSAMTSDQDDLSLVPREFQDLLVDYIVGRCLMINARDEVHMKMASDMVKTWFESMAAAGSNRSQHGNEWVITSRPELNR